MKVSLPFVALVGVAVVLMLCIAGDISNLRWAVANAIRTRLLVRQVDTWIGELDSNLDTIADRVSESESCENLSRSEFLSHVLWEMNASVNSLIRSAYECRYTWSVDNRSSSEMTAYVIGFHLVVTIPEEGVEVGVTKYYYVASQSTRDPEHEAGEPSLVVVSDCVFR
jgi:hypothetical protein